MATFPLLKTGAVSQYPSSREVRHSTEVIRYIDGGEQRFPMRRSAERRWIISLKNVSPAEAAEIRRFFAQQRGRAGVFEFTDPWTATVYPECRFESDNIAVLYEDENACASEFVIRTERG